jgi:hypothetical protein
LEEGFLQQQWCAGWSLWIAGITMPVLFASFLCALGLSELFTFEELQKMSPTQNTPQRALEEATVNTLMDHSKIICKNGDKVGSACNKRNEKGVRHFVKKLTWFDKQKK